MVLLAATTLALAGCGRKGPLDLPPTASAAAVQDDVDSTPPPVATQGNIFNAPADGLPATPKGRKKSFILDPLLGN